MSYLIRLYPRDKEKKPYFWGTHGAWTFLPESFKYMNYIHARVLLLLMRSANKEMKISIVNQKKMELIINLYNNQIKFETTDLSVPLL